MLLQLQTIVKKLGSVCSQTVKTRDKKSSPKRSAKRKDKSVKHKGTSLKDEVATFAQDLGLGPTVEEPCLLPLEAVDTPTESEEEIRVTALIGSIRHPRAGGVTARHPRAGGVADAGVQSRPKGSETPRVSCNPLPSLRRSLPSQGDSVQSRRSRLGEVADVNVQLRTANTHSGQYMSKRDYKRLEETANRCQA